MKVAAFCLLAFASDGRASESQPAEAHASSEAASKGQYVQQSARLDDGIQNHLSPSLDLADDIKLLKTIEVTGWEGQRAIGVINSQNKLVGAEEQAYEEFEGKSAAALIEYGCVDVATRKYKRGQRECTITLFHFKTANGAFGAYSTMRKGSSTFLVRGQGSSEDERSITFFAGKFMALLSSPDQDDDEAKEALIKLADKLTMALPVDQSVKEPQIVASLPHFERLKGSEKYFMGSKSASHHVNAPFLESLLLDQAKGAAYADYTYSRPMAERLNLLLAEYSNPALAQSAFTSYTANMASYSRKTVQKGSNELICKMSDSYLMCGMSGPRVYVISGARKAKSPNILARELRSFN